MPEVTLGLLGAFSHGRGFPQVSAVTNPAVATGPTITIGSDYWERPVSLSFRIVTDANAANRQVSLALLDEGGVILNAAVANGTQAASLTRDYVFTPNVNAPNAVANGVFLSPLFQCFLQPAWSLAVTIGAVQVGDQVSNIRWNRERFITGPGGYSIGTTYYETDDEHRLQVLANELA